MAISTQVGRVTKFELQGPAMECLSDRGESVGIRTESSMRSNRENLELPHRTEVDLPPEANSCTYYRLYMADTVGSRAAHV